MKKKYISSILVTILLAMVVIGMSVAEETYSNRLANEKSPYLLQHANNPVDWYPWGPEAFRKARKEDKPIFLSIGYSTCHWCHVMAEESFSNKEIADILNKNFVSIKVDKEERPDIDNFYMASVMAMTGSGGWPLTVFITPDKKPFFGGTYFPPESMYGRPGLKTLLLSVRQAWDEKRADLLSAGDAIIKGIRESESYTKAGDYSKEAIITTAYLQLKAGFDPDHGGFSNAPKFPMGHSISFLLRYGKRHPDSDAVNMVNKTLIAMRNGGMYDQLGGGFHRYSTDGAWFLPHFEKMLYDQAILSKAYLEAYQLTKDARYAVTAKEIFEYVLSTMSDTGGGFYSAQDADSPLPENPKEKSEGVFYLWSKGEIEQALGREEGNIFSYTYGVLPDGNIDRDPHNEFGETNILFLKHSPEETAEYFKKDTASIRNVIDRARKKLYKVRAGRPSPHRDEKVLVSWNGLMISSLAYGSRVLGEERYARAAERSAEFILSNLVTKDGRLLHRYVDGDYGIPGNIDDYAFFVHGLIDLYEATFDPRYIEYSKKLADKMIELFLDEESGGFFFTAHDADDLPVRQKKLHGGALPSGNSIAILDLIRLSYILADPEYENRAERFFKSFSKEISSAPSAYIYSVIALDFLSGPSREIVIVEGESGAGLDDLLEAIYNQFIPNKVVVLKPNDKIMASKVVRVIPLVKDYIAIDGRTTVYVCKDRVCSMPTGSIEKVKELLGD